MTWLCGQYGNRHFSPALAVELVVAAGGISLEDARHRHRTILPDRNPSSPAADALNGKRKGSTGPCRQAAMADLCQHEARAHQGHVADLSLNELDSHAV